MLWKCTSVWTKNKSYLYIIKFDEYCWCLVKVMFVNNKYKSDVLHWHRSTDRRNMLVSLTSKLKYLFEVFFFKLAPIGFGSLQITCLHISPLQGNELYSLSKQMNNAYLRTLCFDWTTAMDFCVKLLDDRMELQYGLVMSWPCYESALQSV